ncbi:hypothetical protein BSG1_12961 [Bacillus sp. SG-1]|nr:hypothetical protein BSG1_12961 [Bacillus sp. SG-1]
MFRDFENGTAFKPQELRLIPMLDEVEAWSKALKTIRCLQEQRIVFFLLEIVKEASST